MVAAKQRKLGPDHAEVQQLVDFLEALKSSEAYKAQQAQMLTDEGDMPTAQTLAQALGENEHTLAAKKKLQDEV
eukprot:SAG11_NODE_7580_length_1126_cov_1.038948_3_plen_73_part_01